MPVDLNRTQGVICFPPDSEEAIRGELSQEEELVRDAIQEQYDYHPWDEAKIAKGKVVKDALMEAVFQIIKNVPVSADRSAALRKLREARMDCNSAITHDGRY